MELRCTDCFSVLGKSSQRLTASPVLNLNQLIIPPNQQHVKPYHKRCLQVTLVSPHTTGIAEMQSPPRQRGAMNSIIANRPTLSTSGKLLRYQQIPTKTEHFQRQNPELLAL